MRKIIIPKKLEREKTFMGFCENLITSLPQFEFHLRKKYYNGDVFFYELKFSSKYKNMDKIFNYENQYYYTKELAFATAETIYDYYYNSIKSDNKILNKEINDDGAIILAYPDFLTFDDNLKCLDNIYLFGFKYNICKFDNSTFNLYYNSINILFNSKVDIINFINERYKEFIGLGGLGHSFLYEVE